MLAQNLNAFGSRNEFLGRRCFCTRLRVLNREIHEFLTSEKSFKKIVALPCNHVQLHKLFRTRGVLVNFRHPRRILFYGNNVVDITMNKENRNFCFGKYSNFLNRVMLIDCRN